MPLQPPVEQAAVDTFLGTTGIMAYLVVLGVAILGGIVKFVKELNESIHVESIRKMVIKFFFSVLIAAFAGLLAFWFAIIWKFGDPAKAIMVALSGFLGGHAIDGFVGIYKIWIKSQQRSN